MDKQEYQEYFNFMDKQEYYNLKETFSIMQNIAKMVGNVSEILERYPNIMDMPLKDVKEYLINRYSKFDEEAYNEFISNKQNISKQEEEIIKLFKENKLA